jgi:hypothetical protein
MQSVTNTMVCFAAAVVLGGALGTRTTAQAPAPPPPPPTSPQDQIALPRSAGAEDSGLSDLDGMTFDCPKAALNAAAREAANVKSEGTYQFSYFNIHGESHHAAYEIHFRSNHHGEPDLKYCVAIYCQQGWNPATTRPTIALMGADGTHAKGAAHAAACAPMPVTTKPRATKPKGATPRGVKPKG